MELMCSIQLDQASRASYVDSDAFQIDVPGYARGDRPFLAYEPEDFDDPKVAHIDPESIHVEGIRHVAGVDISYDKADQTHAVVAMVILDFPDLNVGQVNPNDCV